MKYFSVLLFLIFFSCNGERNEIKTIDGNSTEQQSYERGKLSVVLIDMQTDFLKDIGKKEKDRIISNQIKVIQRCKKENIPIILVEYIGYGKTEKKLESELRGISIIRIKKNYNDAFFFTDLDQILTEMKVKTLFLMGINSGVCVLYTAYTALEMGYGVIVSSAVVSDINEYYLLESFLWYDENVIFIESLEF